MGARASVHVERHRSVHNFAGCTVRPLGYSGGARSALRLARQSVEVKELRRRQSPPHWLRQVLPKGYKVAQCLLAGLVRWL